MAGSTFMITTVLLIVAIFNASGRKLDGGWDLDKTIVQYTADEKIATSILKQNKDGNEASWVITEWSDKASGKVTCVRETYKGILEGRDHLDITTKYYDITGTKIFIEIHEVNFYTGTTQISDKSKTIFEDDGSKTEMYSRIEYPAGLNSSINDDGIYKYEYGSDDKLIKTTRNATKTKVGSVETTYEVTVVNPDGSKKKTAHVITKESDKIITDIRVNDLDSKDEEFSSKREYTIDYKNNTKVKETTNTIKNSDRSITTDRKVWRTYTNGTRTREQVTTTKFNGELTSADYYPLEIEVEGKDPDLVTVTDPYLDDTDSDSRESDSDTRDMTEPSMKS
ncbi:GSCOCG00002507001-RA-CDS [Cotesia congregata]|uniref:Uncharacterized protein n=1 Tax=Cotesia congregata TaxID=51543 RepID=A0A8J2MHE2_COTCN|nr:GSCOCG00002507001-RA-CDS [Cotesia congregata]CAG5081305.1 Protein of unknown function [Cotesia congregata]